MWDHSSLTRDQTLSPAVEVQSLNHWTTLEVLFCVPYLTHTRTHTRTQLQGDIHRWEVVLESSKPTTTIGSCGWIILEGQ